MMERTYGGKRGHEGCDIMASYNHRGVYPVVSVCDGTLEKDRLAAPGRMAAWHTQ